MRAQTVYTIHSISAVKQTTSRIGVYYIMYNIGDMVVYANAGLCLIDDIRTEDFLGEKQLFYVMTPVYSKGSTVFTPVDNTKVVMRPTVSKDELYEILSIETNPEGSWIENNHERRQRHSEILKSCDIRSTLSAVRCLIFKKEEKERVGKRLHASDEKAIADLQRMLFGEIAYVLDINYDEVVQMFINNI